MKKFFTVMTALVMIAALLAGCGEPAENSSNEGGDKLQVIEGLAEDLYPDLASVPQLSGTIDIEMPLGAGPLVGWKAVAAEYVKLQDNRVTVNIDEDLSTESYSQQLNQIANNPQSSTWDFVQGNYLPGSRAEQVLYEIMGDMNSENHYAGNKRWVDLVSSESYNPDGMGGSQCYVLRSSSIVTCWFVNRTAFDAAVAQGYLNSEGQPAAPVTWDNLISLCEHMSQAGYARPLGLPLDSESINEVTFSWFAQIYGDQYYRDMYQYFNAQPDDGLWEEDAYPFVFNPEDENIENQRGFAQNENKVWNALLDRNEEYMWQTADFRYADGAEKKLYAQYAGPYSDRFECLMRQFAKMIPYITQGYTTAGSSTAVMNDFMASESQPGHPMIYLATVDFGLTFNSADAGFELMNFEWPYMVCDCEDPDYPHADDITTHLRDVGGAGGYISIINHDLAQNQLNVDFLKFFMSPYGQAIYMSAIHDADLAPTGPSLINDVALPSDWQEMFSSIEYNGPTGRAWNHMMRASGSQSGDNSAQTFYNNMQAYLLGNMSLEDYQAAWQTSLQTSYRLDCVTYNWAEWAWQVPGAREVR